MSKTKEIEIKVEGKQWEEAKDKAYKKASSKVTIDGFRKGKAPKDVFLKKYGEESLWADAADEVIDASYMKMLKDNADILEDIVAKPDIALEKIDEKGVEFKFILTLKPDVKLGQYKNLDVKKAKAEVTEEEIAKVIDNMRERYAENVLKEGTIENGDIAIIDFEGFVDEKAFEGGKAENYALTIGSGSFIPGFEEQLIGLKEGDEKDVNVTFPKDYHAEELKGKKATFKVKVHEVKEIKVPELDKEFFEDLGMEGVDTKEKLEASISENILSHKEAELENKYMDDLFEQAAKDVEVDIPDVMIKEEIDRMLKNFEEHMKSQGMSLDLYYQMTGQKEEDLRTQMKEEATKRVTYRLMLEEIAKEEKIEITTEEAEKEAENYAKKYEMKKEEFLKLFGGLDMVKYDMKMRKAIEIIKGEEK